MKTFKTLSIGDTIYRLCDKHYLGNPDKEQIYTIVIDSLSVDENNGNLLINQVVPYSGSRYWSLIIGKDKLNKSSYNFDPKENTHRRGFYFLNADSANFIVRRAVLNKIREAEASIPRYIKNTELEIRNLRSTFHELLNPSHYPNFKTLTDVQTQSN